MRRFSARNIEKARFIRAAIEKEVLVRAAANCDEAGAERLKRSLIQQEEVMAQGDFDVFGRLDYEFHKTLCEVAGASYAFDVIREEKAKIDRLCMLGHHKEQRIPDLVADHRAIADAVIAHDEAAAAKAGMTHLSRLDETIERIKAQNADFFEQTDR